MNMQRSVKKFAIMLVLCFFAYGCAPTLGFKGDALPASQVALIEGSVYFYGIATQQLGIQSVDDMVLGGSGVAAPDKVQVLPGRHYCKVRFLVNSGNRTTWVDYPLRIDVAADRTYKLEFENHDGETYIWMNNSATGQLVAGQKPGKG